LIVMQNISMKRQVTRLNENRKLVQAFNFKSAISEQAKSTGLSLVWASTKIFSQENHLLSRKIYQFSTSQLLVETRVTTSRWSTEWSCSLVIKSRLHNVIQIFVDNGTWMSSESPDKLSIYFVGVWGLCLLWQVSPTKKSSCCFFSLREVWI